jgi:hypothetical protein
MRWGRFSLLGDDTSSARDLVLDTVIGTGIAVFASAIAFAAVGLLAKWSVINLNLGGVTINSSNPSRQRARRLGPAAAGFILFAGIGAGFGSLVASKRHHSFLPGAATALLSAWPASVLLGLAMSMGPVRFRAIGPATLPVLVVLLGLLGAAIGTVWRSGFQEDMIGSDGRWLSPDSSLVRAAAELGSRDVLDLGTPGKPARPQLQGGAPGLEGALNTILEAGTEMASHGAVQSVPQAKTVLDDMKSRDETEDARLAAFVKGAQGTVCDDASGYTPTASASTMQPCPNCGAPNMSTAQCCFDCRAALGEVRDV